MQRKPIILIMTSKDEVDGVSLILKDAIQRMSTHNAVILSDDKYGGVMKMTKLDKLMELGLDYQSLLEKKDSNIAREKSSEKKPTSKRVVRIMNAVKRFRPEYILTLTPYAHHSAIEAKKRAGFDTPVINMLFSFTLDGRPYDDETSVFLVENSDLKTELVKEGVRSKNIVTLGLPFYLRKRSLPEIASAKQEYGLPRSRTVFLNVSDLKILEEITSLLVDQGDILNLVIYAEENKDFAEVRDIAASAQNTTVAFIGKKELFDSYLAISDALITEYDVSAIYKAFKAEVPVTVFGGKGANSLKDIDFLVEKGLILSPKDTLDIVNIIYRLQQTDISKKLTDAAAKWVEMSNVDNIAGFLVSFFI